MNFKILLLTLFFINFDLTTAFIYECDFKNTSFGFACELASFNASDPNKALIIGENVPEPHTEIKFFYADSVKFSRFPNLVIFALRFSNPESVAVTNASLNEIWRSDLEQLGEDLKNLWLDFNEIEKIPGNLFENCRNLELISFKGNKIKEVGLDLFSNLDNLKTIKFSANPCYSPESNVTKNEIKKVIYVLCKVRNPEFTKMKEDEMEVKAKVSYASLQWNNYHLQDKLEGKRATIRILEDKLTKVCEIVKQKFVNSTEIIEECQIL